MASLTALFLKALGCGVAVAAPVGPWRFFAASDAHAGLAPGRGNRRRQLVPEQTKSRHWLVCVLLGLKLTGEQHSPSPHRLGMIWPRCPIPVAPTKAGI